MAQKLTFRKGLETNRSSVVPAEGELLYTTDGKKSFIGDNSTSGGLPVNPSAADTLTSLKTATIVGSGLNGDFVDGLTGTQLLKNDQDGTITGELTVNDKTLAAINTIANANAVVDVFLYDTTKDSDGGAWTKKTSHTSWYNETLNTATRGATNEFPALALIVTETDTVTIYDATDSSVPMWMTINQNGGSILRASPSSTLALNGTVIIGSASSVYELRVIEDVAYRHHNVASPTNTGKFTLPLSGRDVLANYDGTNIYPIVNASIHDVAMTVFPNAPIDTETGLPISTIAVATNGGISIIHNDGSVVDISHTDVAIVNNVHFADDNSLWYNAVNFVHQRKILPVTNDTTSVRYLSGNSDTYYPAYVNPIYTVADGYIGNNNTTQANTSSFAQDSIGSSGGLFLHTEYESNDNLTNHITKDYQTGWTTVNTKGVFLANSKTLDRSGHTNPLTEIGTVTEGPVVAGAELMGYSGFTTTNFLEQPTNTDFNFGTGDFSVMGWFKKGTGTGLQYILQNDDTSSNVGIGSFTMYWEPSSGSLVALTYDGTVQITTSTTPGSSDFMFVCVRSIGLQMDLYINGKRESSVTRTSIWNADHITRFGCRTDGVVAGSTQVMTLIRIGASSPSDDQIKEIYETERHLFKETAACTLTSATDSVNALAYDDDTQLLHLAGTTNMDTFKGLTRVASEAGVYTSLSAIFNMVIKGN